MCYRYLYIGLFSTRLMRKNVIMSIVLVCFVVSLFSVVGFSASLGETCDMSTNWCDSPYYCSTCSGSGTCGTVMPDCGDFDGGDGDSEGGQCPDGVCDSWEQANPEACPADCTTSSQCGNGVCDSDEDYNACPQDCPTNSQSCDGLGGSCCNSGTYCPSGQLVGQANDCVVCCASGSCVSDSDASSCGNNICDTGEDENSCSQDCHVDMGVGSCASDLDCSIASCPSEFSKMGSSVCSGGVCVCCFSTSDCQDGYSCNNGFCTGGDYVPYDSCQDVRCGDYTCSRNDQGQLCSNECDSDCNSLGTCNYDNICSTNENADSCSDCYSTSQIRCGNRPDGSENYCASNDWCANYNNGWCCPNSKQVICGDGQCVDSQSDCGETQMSGFCGDGICQDGEYDCHDDCGRPPEERLRDGCWYEYRFGKEIVKCEKKNMCPDESEMDRVKRNCKEEGGRTVMEKDPYNGCSFVHCEFGEKFDFNAACPTDEQLERETDKCFNIGGNPVPKMMGGGFGSIGCKVIMCEGRGHEQNICAEYDNPNIKESFYNDCGGKQNTVVDIDPQGCPITRCGDPTTEGLTQIPDTAYGGCPGELLLERDENNVIIDFKCIFKGGSAYTTVSRDEVTKIPEIEDVLAVAMKLEGMNAKFIGLSDKINDLALFYQGKANSASGETKEKYELEAKRFEKVADMMLSAGDKFDSVRDEIREVAGKSKLTTYDVVSLKTSIRKLKEESIRKIIFAMLGDADEVAEEYSINVDAETAEDSDLTDIGSDGGQFDQAFRTCEPTLFYPDGEGGTEVKIKAKNDIGNCIMEIDMTEQFATETAMGDGPPPEFIEFMAEKAGVALEKNSAGDYIINMVCEIPNYQEGMPQGADGPPTEYFEGKCKGLGFEFMKMGPQDNGGSNNGQQGGQQSYCGDGMCDFDEKETCPNDCGGFQDDFRDQEYEQQYDQNPGPGYYDQGGDQNYPQGGDQYYDQGEQYPSDGGEYYPPQGDEYYPDQGGQPSSNPCPDGVCDEWEQQGGQCVADCGY